MTGSVAGGLVLALASALALNWSYFAQHAAASELPPLSLRHPVASLRSLFTHLRWLLGFAVGVGGWVLYLAALKLAPLSLVQAVSAGGIGVLALLAWRLGGTRLERREWVALALALSGLVALAGSLAGATPESARGGVLAVAVWLAVSLAVAGLTVGSLGRVLRAGAPFGIAAGVLYAAGDVATKEGLSGGVRALFLVAMLACHGIAFVTMQLGFQRGGVLATAGLASLLTNAVPIVAGVALFGESLPGGVVGVVRVMSFVAVVVGGAGLARGGGEPQPDHSGSDSIPTPSAIRLM